MSQIPNSERGVGQGFLHGIHSVWTCSGLVGFFLFSSGERESMTTLSFFMTLPVMGEVEQDPQKLLSLPGSKYRCVGVSGPWR